MEPIGFVHNIKVEKLRIEKDEALEAWIDILNELCKEATENFANIKDISRDDKEKIFKNVEEGNRLHERAKQIADYIGDYAYVNRIDLRGYIKTNCPDFNYASVIFQANNENSKSSETKQK